jgi:hypothetical protein
MKTILLEKFNTLNSVKIANGKENMLTLSLQMLLIVFLIYMNDNGYLSIFMPVAIIPGILFKEVRENKYFWVFISAMGCTFYLVRDLVGYVPNHKHVFAYVILMITIGMFYKSKIDMLSFIKNQSKYIIGLIFLFAVIGKLLAPEFLNGAFFEFTNITDPRFFGFTSQIGKVDFNLLKENEHHLAILLNTSNPDMNFILHSADKMTKLGIILSYWTIFIEGMIAISFCLPSRFLIAKYRNVFLVIFILTTYPIATVTGFAIILTTLGFIQSLNENKFSGYSWFYLMVYIMLPLNHFPFTRLLTLF